MVDTDPPTVRPFYCGTQYIDWTDANCCTCRKQAPADASLDEMPCEIEAALALACLDAGMVPLPIVDRMGHGNGRRIWPCREHDPPFVNVRADGTVDKSIPRPEVPHA